MICLHKLGDEVKSAVEAEQLCRQKALDEVDQKIVEVSNLIDKKLSSKARKDEVQKALWLKVDKE